MITMQMFVQRMRVLYPTCRGFCLVECCETILCTDANAVFAWDMRTDLSKGVLDYLIRSRFVAAIYFDGSVRLLSRDEDERKLFQTLWELEK